MQKPVKFRVEPEIVTRGVRGFDRATVSLKDARRVVAAAIAGASRQTLQDESLLKEHMRVELKRFIQKLPGARPVIMPVVVQSLVQVSSFEVSSRIR